MITKTDLERIAKALGQGASRTQWQLSRPDIDNLADDGAVPYPAAFVTVIVSRIADALADSNPNFVRSKFYNRVLEYTHK
jgi:hypothetical protein